MKKKFIILFVLVLVSSIVFSQKEETNSSVNFKRNSITISMSDIVFKRVSFEYEHIVGREGVLSITIPFSVSFGDPDAMYKSLYYSNFEPFDFKYIVDFTDWYIGLGANFYPTGQGKASFFLGPEIRLGPAQRYSDEYYYHTYYSDDNQEEYTREEYLQSTFLLNIGGAYQPVNNFTIALKLGVGISSSINNQISPAFYPTFKMGFKF
jgi:hypothetical protein